MTTKGTGAKLVSLNTVDMRTFQVVQKDTESGLSRIVRRKLSKADAYGSAEWLNLCETDANLKYVVEE